MKAQLAVILLLAAAPGAARDPFTPEDVWSWRTTSEPRISPDGKWVVYVESWNDRAANAAFGNLRLASTDGRQRRALTEGNWRDGMPRWSADSSRIAWVAERGGRPQIRVRAFEGAGEVEIALDTAPLGLAWSPSGDRLAFTARAAAEPPPAWASPTIAPLLLRPPGRVRLFVVDAKGGKPREIPTSGSELRGEPSWMDGNRVVIARASGVDAIQLADGKVKTLVDAPARYESALVSPDGGKVAYVASTGGRQAYAVRKLHLVNSDGSRPMVLAGEIDRDVTEPQWSPDSRTIYFLADDSGFTRVHAARINGTTRQVTSAPERLRGFSLADNGRAAMLRHTPNAAGDVYTLTVDRITQPITLAIANERLLAERDLAPAEEIGFSSEGRNLQAWLIKPARVDAAHKCPLLLDIAEAPVRMYGPEIELRSQVLAARGICVLLVNPRGTPGYGEEFGNALRTRYPGSDFDDLVRGAAYAAAQPYVDGTRVAAAGGMLAAWAAAATDRFRGVVARAPVAALFPDQLRTPALILAGDGDRAAGELYAALQARNVEAALLRLPDQSPRSQVLEWEAVAAWLSR